MYTYTSASGVANLATFLVSETEHFVLRFLVAFKKINLLVNLRG